MLNAAASRSAKQQGMQLALDMAGDWKTDVLVELRAWLAVHRGQGNTTMTMEQFRAQAVNQPASHKAWGPLPAMACKAGLIAPMSHPDGSPVYRLAESARTHSHPVRVWALLDSAFVSAPAAGAITPSVHGAGLDAAGNRASALLRVGEGRVSHSGEAA